MDGSVTKHSISLHRSSAAAILLGTLLAGCNNTYAPPPVDGKPHNWGQQHYLDNQRNQEQIENRMED
jgi:hypothetical protein